MYLGHRVKVKVTGVQSVRRWSAFDCKATLPVTVLRVFYCIMFELILLHCLRIQLSS